MQVAVGGRLRVWGGAWCVLVTHYERDILATVAGNHAPYSSECVEGEFYEVGCSPIHPVFIGVG